MNKKENNNMKKQKEQEKKNTPRECARKIERTLTEQELQG